MNLTKLHKQFSTQIQCISYLEKLRWGKKPVCAHCGSDKVYKRKGSIKWHCNNENKDYSVLYGTIFENTRLPLPKYFQVIFLMINAKQGISALQLSRDIGITYRTTWYACHRVRCCMIDNELRLEGIVQMDETYIGGKPRKSYSKDASSANLSQVINKRGRGTKKVPAVGIAEKKGQVYVKIIEKLTSRNLLAMLKQVVKTDESVLITDSFKSYKKFDKEIEHITIKQSEDEGEGLKTISTIHGFFSIIKGGIRGNYKSLSKKYLPFYLAEFSYKYNRRHLEKNAFEEILKNAVKDEKCFLNYKPKGDVKEIVYKSKKQAS